MRKGKREVIFLVACVVALLGLRGGVAHAQQDHFKCYDVTDENLLPPAVVTLTDQFGTEQDVIVQVLTMFSNPVQKNDEQIINPDNHLTWYEITGNPPQEREWLVSNQFGADQSWTVGVPKFLLVPAQKIEPFYHDPPSGLDHYKCYEATSGPTVGLEVTLIDQFHPELVTVLGPKVFCNPVEKLLPDGTSYPIIDRATHLACYEIVPHEPFNLPVFAIDQFAPMGIPFTTLDNQLLCVPSTKKEKPSGPCAP